MEEKLRKKALGVLNDFAETLDDRGWQYERNDEELSLMLKVGGEDLPINLFVFVQPATETLTILSPLPFVIEMEKRADLAMAVNFANYGLSIGSFDYNLGSGEIRFRATLCYLDSLIGKEAYAYLTDFVTYFVDRYNDRFLMLAKGMMDLKGFVESEKE